MIKISISDMKMDFCYSVVPRPSLPPIIIIAYCMQEWREIVSVLSQALFWGESLGTRLGGRRPYHIKRGSLMNLSMQEAHSHQFRHTFHYGAALRFDGFALLFNILCERQESRVRGKRRVRKGREGERERREGGRERGGER